MKKIQNMVTRLIILLTTFKKLSKNYILNFHYLFFNFIILDLEKYFVLNSFVLNSRVSLHPAYCYAIFLTKL